MEKRKASTGNEIVLLDQKGGEGARAEEEEEELGRTDGKVVGL